MSIPRYDLPRAAPEPLRLVQRFVNTVDLQHEREWLATPADLERWLREAGLPLGGALRSADLRRAHQLRDALRALLIANTAGGRPPPEAIATVNRLARLGLELDGDARVVPRPLHRGAASTGPAFQQVLVVAFAAMLDGTWQRLKACRNCRWAFYDASRNRTAGWCSMAICGNRLKTRRYRARAAGRG